MNKQSMKHEVVVVSAQSELASTYDVFTPAIATFSNNVRRQTRKFTRQFIGGLAHTIKSKDSASDAKKAALAYVESVRRNRLVPASAGVHRHADVHIDVDVNSPAFVNLTDAALELSGTTDKAVGYRYQHLQHQDEEFFELRQRAMERKRSRNEEEDAKSTISTAKSRKRAVDDNSEA